MTREQTPRIVVGVDGAIPSQQALRWPATRRDLRGVHQAGGAWEYPTTYGLASLSDWNPETDADRLLTGAADEVFGTSRPAHMRLVVREGYPAKVLLDAADDGALMLIAGSRGHGGFAGLLLGAVSTFVAQHAT